MKLMVVTASTKSRSIPKSNRVANSIPNRKVIFHAASESYSTELANGFEARSRTSGIAQSAFFREIIFRVPHNIVAKRAPNTMIIVLEPQTNVPSTIFSHDCKTSDINDFLRVYIVLDVIILCFIKCVRYLTLKEILEDPSFLYSSVTMKND